MSEGKARSAFPSTQAISYEAIPSHGRGRGGGTGSPPSAVKISIGVADGDAPLSLLPWKDPASPRFGKTATTANKMTIQSMNSTLSLDMRASKRENIGRETWIGMPPSELRASLNGESKRRVARV